MNFRFAAVWDVTCQNEKSSQHVITLKSDFGVGPTKAWARLNGELHGRMPVAFALTTIFLVTTQEPRPGLPDWHIIGGRPKIEVRPNFCN